METKEFIQSILSKSLREKTDWFNSKSIDDRRTFLSLLSKDEFDLFVG